VISRNPAFLASGVELTGSLAGAIELSESDEIMVIGGGQLYALAYPMAQRMILTLIDVEPEADTWFPAWDERDWVQTGEKSFPANDKNHMAYRIIELSREPA